MLAGPTTSKMRAAIHTAAIAPSTQPEGVGRPVQLRTAVKRKPVITAMLKPNTISWLCQDMPCR